MTERLVSSRSSPICVYREKISLVSGGRCFLQFQALLLCECPATEKANQTFRSGKNKVMRIFVFREVRAEFASAVNQRARNGPVTAGLCIGLLDGAHDQRANGGA